MGEIPIVEREWILGVLSDEVRIRCRYKRRGHQILEYTVQLEIWHGETWRAVGRYDNAHEFCHCDTIHADGSQEKAVIHRGDANANFTWAIQELRAQWESQQTRFLAEVKP